MADVADAVGYSPFHLSRLFTQRVGLSPIRFLACHRFQLAKRLLLVEGLSIHETCHEVAFSSPGTFGTRFRREVGVSPGELRRLADDIAETTATPFTIAPPTEAAAEVQGRVEIPEGMPGAPQVWIGLYAHPVPAGVPAAGVLRHGSGEFRLPVLPGCPWLLATLVDDEDPVAQLAGESPLVAVHPAPVQGPTRVVLRFRRALTHEPPILTALPALRW